MAKSTATAPRRKASAPKQAIPDGFPLWPHPSGRWCKKIKGKFHYFGKVGRDEERQAALEEWLRVKDHLLAGREAPVKGDELTIKFLCNAFLTAKTEMLAAGEITARTMYDWKRTTDRIVRVFGKLQAVSSLTAEDFNRLRKDIAKNQGMVGRGNEIQRCRSVFKYAFDSGLLDTPLRFGPNFRKPARKLMRRERNRNGSRVFDPADVRTLIDSAGPQLKAMILLSANCAFGPSDIGQLPLSALDLEAGWINYPRPKTEVPRRIPLWAETVAAIREWLEKRPKGRDAESEKLVFLTQRRVGWYKGGSLDDDGKVRGGATSSPISAEIRKLMKTAGIHKHRWGLYTLRHCVETYGGECKDQTAVDFVMGHADESMAAIYREGISDTRLRAVVEHVHGWLYGAENVPNVSDS